MSATNLIQTVAQVMRIQNFLSIGEGQALSCSGTSAYIALVGLPLGSLATDVLFINTGTTPIFVTFGNAPLVATIPVNGTPGNGMILLPNTYLPFAKGNATYVAGITGGAANTLYFYQGCGS